MESTENESYKRDNILSVCLQSLSNIWFLSKHGLPNIVRFQWDVSNARCVKRESVVYYSVVWISECISIVL